MCQSTVDGEQRMRKNYKITPEGTGDLLFSECVERRAVESKICKMFARGGYNEVRTPFLEFYDVFNLGDSFLPMDSMYKLSDNKGRLMVLRPDNTLPIARMTSTKLSNALLPIRVYYSQTSFAIGQSLRGESDQNKQTGIELIGAGGRKADLEVIVMAINALRSNLDDFRFEIGHSGIFKALAENLCVDDETREELRDYIESKNYGALSEALEQLPDSSSVRALRQLPRRFGGGEVLTQAYEVFEGCGVTEYLDYLGDIYGRLSQLGLGDKLIIDFGIVHRKDYYTGIVFTAYAHGSGNKVLSGGRYDGLLKKFGFPTPACGFAVDIDALTKACSHFHRVTAKIPQILVHSDEGFEIKALQYAHKLASDKHTYEFSVCDTLEEAEEYARKKGIPRIDRIGEEIEIIEI